MSPRGPAEEQHVEGGQAQLRGVEEPRVGRAGDRLHIHEIHEESKESTCRRLRARARAGRGRQGRVERAVKDREERRQRHVEREPDGDRAPQVEA